MSVTQSHTQTLEKGNAFPSLKLLDYTKYNKLIQGILTTDIVLSVFKHKMTNDFEVEIGNTNIIVVINRYRYIYMQTGQTGQHVCVSAQ